MVSYSAVGPPHITANLSGRWSGLDQEIVFLFSKKDRWCRMHRWEYRLFHKGEEKTEWRNTPAPDGGGRIGKDVDKLPRWCSTQGWRADTKRWN
jgi:hypothetical protein